MCVCWAHGRGCVCVSVCDVDDNVRFVFQKKRELEEQKMCDDVMKTVIREDTLESAEAE